MSNKHNNRLMWPDAWLPRRSLVICVPESVKSPGLPLLGRAKKLPSVNKIESYGRCKMGIYIYVLYTFRISS